MALRKRFIDECKKVIDIDYEKLYDDIKHDKITYNPNWFYEVVLASIYVAQHDRRNESEQRNCEILTLTAYLEVIKEEMLPHKIKILSMITHIELVNKILATDTKTHMMYS